LGGTDSSTDFARIGGKTLKIGFVSESLLKSVVLFGEKPVKT
jgi:hypothetical protein